MGLSIGSLTLGDSWCVEFGEWGKLTGQLMHSLGLEEAGLGALVRKEEERLGGIDIVNSNCF